MCCLNLRSVRLSELEAKITVKSQAYSLYIEDICEITKRNTVASNCLQGKLYVYIDACTCIRHVPMVVCA